MKIHSDEIKKILLVALFFGLKTVWAQSNPVMITTLPSPTVNPYIESAFSSNQINVTARLIGGGYRQVWISGKLERLSPSPFTITYSPNANLPRIILEGTAPVTLMPWQLEDAFGSFKASNYLVLSGISLNDISVGGQIRLPPGRYRACFLATDPDTLTTISNPNLGCGTFTICGNDAPPQLTYPTSNLAIGSSLTIVQPNTPVNFAWLPPRSTCGSPGPVNYNLEIREILNNQAVTDAINNPIIFQKTGIPSTAFLLDLNLYQNVLQRGKRYVIRVKAVNINLNSPVTIDNDGYSRVEAFQFGTENVNTPNTWTSQSYYLPLEKRNSNYWDGYESRKGHDTLIPVEEYIAYKLMQQNIAYNEDAIELLVSLNPELKDKSLVHLYEPLNLPEFPEVPTSLQKDFEAAHASSLKPNAEELILFRKYLDSLKGVNRSTIPDQFNQEYIELMSHLNKFNSEAPQLNGTSLNFINTMLSELVFSLRKSTNAGSNSNYNHLHGLASDIKALAAIPAGTSFVREDSLGNGLSSNFRYGHVAALYGSMLSVAYYSEEIKTHSEDYYILVDQLIPFNVVVFRPVQEPGKPEMNAPDLRNTFRIFYNTSNLYDSRNPEIGAKSPGPLASTTQVSIPRGVKFKFWTLNMRSHKLTLPQDLDVDEIFSNSQNKDLKDKKKTIILKVE